MTRAERLALIGTTEEHLRAQVAASREVQGLPRSVQDPATLDRVVALLRGEPDG